MRKRKSAAQIKSGKKEAIPRHIGIRRSASSSTLYSPDTDITRADFIMALGKIYGADASGYKTSSFNDVSRTNPAMPYIEWASENKIVAGIGGGKFGSDTAITRESMAVREEN